MLATHLKDFQIKHSLIAIICLAPQQASHSDALIYTTSKVRLWWTVSW